MSTPMMQILQGEDLQAQAPVAPPTSARATVAAVPTLGVIGGPAAPPAAPPEATAGPQAAPADAAAATPAPARAVAQQGAQVAQPPPKFKLPPVDEMVADYQRWTMMAADPDVAREVAPRLQAWRNLTLQQHAAAFDGDPMASPEQAAAYARHMGKVQGQLGQPMPWEQAAKIAEYTEGRKAQMPQQFLAGMNRYDKAAVQPFIDDVFGDGWTLQSLAPSKANIGGTEMEVPSITVVGPNGETRTYTSVEAAARFGNYEGAYKLSELNRKREIEAAQADLDLARANQDPAAAAAAFERINTLRGGSAGKGRPTGGVNPQDVRAYLQQKGVPPAHIAGILANIEGESSFNPTATHDDNTGYGLFGHRLERRDAMFKHAGTNQPTWQQQLDYALTEKDMKNYLAVPHADGASAAKHFVDVFERPKYPDAAKAERARLAQKYAGGSDDPVALGARVLGMPPPGAAPGAQAFGRSGLTKSQQDMQRDMAKEQVKIIKDATISPKERERQLADLEDVYRSKLPPEAFGTVVAPAPAAAGPAGMPTQPPGAAGKPPAAATPPATPAKPVQARTTEELAALLEQMAR